MQLITPLYTAIVRSTKNTRAKENYQDMKRFKQLNVVVVPATSEYQTTTKYGGTDYIASEHG